jgi:hypothetical protein
MLYATNETQVGPRPQDLDARSCISRVSRFLRVDRPTLSSLGIFSSRCRVLSVSEQAVRGYRVNTTNRPIRVSCRDLDAWCLGPSCLVFFIDRSHLTLSSLPHFTGEISRVDGEMRCQRRRTPRRTDRFARLPPVSKAR